MVPAVGMGVDHGSLLLGWVKDNVSKKEKPDASDQIAHANRLEQHRKNSHEPAADEELTLTQEN